MSDSSGKWLPFNLDGSAHECKDKSQPQQQQEPQPRQPNKVLSLEDLDTRLKRVEYTLYGE
jgi:hypothetical protein